MNFAQRMRNKFDDEQKLCDPQDSGEHNWHNCNTRDDTCWIFRCPSTTYNNIWKKWGIYFGVPKHRCYSTDNYCRFGCPLSWTDPSLSVPKHECLTTTICQYQCPQSKWMWSANRFIRGPFGTSIRNNCKTFKRAVIRKFL